MVLENLVIEEDLRRLRQLQHLFSEPVEAREVPMADHAGEDDAHERLLLLPARDLAQNLDAAHVRVVQVLEELLVQAPQANQEVPLALFHLK